MGIKCFMIEPTNRSRRWLRRYSTAEADCPAAPGRKYHNAMAQIEDGACHLIDDERPHFAADDEATAKDTWPRDDARWPTHCACGYEFQPGDHWQVFWHAIYRRPDTGDEMTLYDCPPGAMWEAFWMPYSKGPDGKCLAVALPPDGGNHSWCIDGPSYQDGKEGPGWTRTGTPPNLTVSPSILTPRYHGWLRNGELVPA